MNFFFLFFQWNTTAVLVFMVSVYIFGQSNCGVLEPTLSSEIERSCQSEQVAIFCTAFWEFLSVNSDEWGHSSFQIMKDAQPLPPHPPVGIDSLTSLKCFLHTGRRTHSHTARPRTLGVFVCRSWGWKKISRPFLSDILLFVWFQKSLTSQAYFSFPSLNDILLYLLCVFMYHLVFLMTLK